MTTEATPAPAPETTSADPAFNHTVGTRDLSGYERQALLDRLERNGTPLEAVNAITKAGEVEIREDTRTDVERKFDERNAAHETPEAYLPQINLTPSLSANAPSAAIAEVEQHAAAFAHALQLPKASAGETVRQMVSEAVRVNNMSPDAKAAHIAKSQAVLSKALGGPERLSAAIKDVQAYLDKAGNSDFAKLADPGLTDPGTFLTLYHAAQRATFRASRNR